MQTAQLKENFNALLKFIQDVNDGLQSLTTLVVSTLQASSSVKLPNGTVGAPALQWTNSSTTGLYRVGASEIGVSTGGVKAVDIDSAQNITQPLQPAFLVGLSAPQTITEPGFAPANRTVQFDSEVYDVAGNFNTTTFTFTAPKTGIYLFTLTIDLVVNSGTISYDLTLATSNRNYYITSQAGSSASQFFKEAVLADMDSGDTATLYFTMNSSGADTMTIGTYACRLCGTLVN